MDVSPRNACEMNIAVSFYLMIHKFMHYKCNYRYAKVVLRQAFKTQGRRNSCKIRFSIKLPSWHCISLLPDRITYYLLARMFSSYSLNNRGIASFDGQIYLHSRERNFLRSTFIKRLLKTRKIMKYLLETIFHYVLYLSWNTWMKNYHVSCSIRSMGTRYRDGRSNQTSDQPSLIYFDRYKYPFSTRYIFTPPRTVSRR